MVLTVLLLKPFYGFSYWRLTLAVHNLVLLALLRCALVVGQVPPVDVAVWSYPVWGHLAMLIDWDNLLVLLDG